MDWQTHITTHFKYGDQNFLRRWRDEDKLVRSVAYYDRSGTIVEKAQEIVEIPFPATIPVNRAAFFMEFDEKVHSSRMAVNGSARKHSGDPGWADPGNGYWKSTRNNLEKLWTSLAGEAAANDENEDANEDANEENEEKEGEDEEGGDFSDGEFLAAVSTVQNGGNAENVEFEAALNVSEAAADVAAANGLELVRSNNKTGYKGVFLCPGKIKPFRACNKRDGVVVHLGYFATAEEAALAYARAVGAADTSGKAPKKPESEPAPPEPPAPPPPAPPPPPPAPPPATVQAIIASWLHGQALSVAPGGGGGGGGKAKLVTVEVPSRAHQLEHYCGNIPELMEYARKNYGHAGSGGMNEERMRRWYMKPGHWQKYMPQAFKHLRFGNGPEDVQMCHVLSVGAFGGHPWPYDFVVALGKVNNHFREYFPREWRDYIGEQAYQDATSFHRYVSLKAQATIAYGDFDPVSCKMLTKRKR